MGNMRARRLTVLALGLLLIGCTTATPVRDAAAPQRSTAPAPAPTAPKRMVLAIKGEPALLSSDIGLYGGGTVPGTQTVLDLLHTGVGARDPSGKFVPRLATALPTVENGRWRVLPDGTMETTWELNPATRWHDGHPYTADDLVFTLQVKKDKDLPFVDIAFDYIESVAAPDPQTVTVKWSRTYLDADSLFSMQGTSTLGGVLPRHLLESSYRNDKENFMQLPYWNESFVGTGPFKMKEWARGSHYLLIANDAYLLGRPKLDEVEVKFILDATVMVANLLAGTVDVVLGGLTIPLDMGLDLKERWAEGRMETQITRTFVVYPQFVNPSPPIIGSSVAFRRALVHAIDRQGLGEAFQPGLPTQIAHSFGIPSELGYAEITAAVPHYDYDPRRAEAMFAELGYHRGSDGIFRDRSGEVLKSEIRSTTSVDPRIMMAIGDQWQRFGMQMETVVIPAQRASDREYRANFPGFVFTGIGVKPLAQLQRSHSRETPLPENNYNGNNTSRYRNPELDSLIDRILTTIPVSERITLMVQAHRIVIDQVVLMPLWYPVEPAIFARKSIQHIELNPNVELWQVHQWDRA